VLSVVAWRGVFLVHDVQVFIAFGLVTGAWGFALASNSFAADGSARPGRRGPFCQRPGADRSDEPDASAFALELRCPRAAPDRRARLPRMTRCEFCARSTW